MRIWKTVFGFGLAWLALSVQAQTAYQRLAFIDADDNPDTGCAYSVADSQEGESIVVGAETAFGSTIFPMDADPYLEYWVCRSGGWQSTYDPLPPPSAEIPVGLNLGEDGLDVIEFGHANVPAFLASYGNNRWTLHFLIAAWDEKGDFSGYDHLGPVAVFGGNAASFQAVPWASPWAIAALMATVLLIGASIVRRRPDLLMVVACVATLATGGIAWAATHLLDGQIGDWAGISGFDDPAGDTTNGDPAIDIRRAFFAREGNGLYFRLDVTDVEAAP